MKTLICFSGGVDSALLVLTTQGDNEAIGFDYGQAHLIELTYARQFTARVGMPFHVLKIPNIPLIDDVVFAGRNLVLVSHAISFAAASGFDRVALGCNKSDAKRFPDCRPEFWSSINAASLAAYGISIDVPLLEMEKSEILARSFEMGILAGETWSCYNPQNGKPCNVCLACVTRGGQ